MKLVEVVEMPLGTPIEETEQILAEHFGRGYFEPASGLMATLCGPLSG